MWQKNNKSAFPTCLNPIFWLIPGTRKSVTNYGEPKFVQSTKLLNKYVSLKNASYVYINIIFKHLKKTYTCELCMWHEIVLFVCYFFLIKWFKN